MTPDHKTHSLCLITERDNLGHLITSTDIATSVVFNCDLTRQPSSEDVRILNASQRPNEKIREPTRREVSWIASPAHSKNAVLQIRSEAPRAPYCGRKQKQITRVPLQDIHVCDCVGGPCLSPNVLRQNLHTHTCMLHGVSTFLTRRRELTRGAHVLELELSFMIELLERPNGLKFGKTKDIAHRTCYTRLR